MGDPAGIGPEIIQNAWLSLRKAQEYCFLVIGDPACFPDARCLSHPAEAANVFPEALPLIQQSSPLGELVSTGSPSGANAAAIRAAIEDATGYALEGKTSAVVTAPISKSVMYDAGFDFPGHTELLGELTAGTPVSGPGGPLMMLSGGGLRVVLTSIHVSLRAALNALEPGRLKNVVRLTHHALQQDFGIAKPRLAMAGLNPHAGEDGALGREEIDIINPTAAELRAEGINITDALPPDTMFHEEARARYDAAICHYHDQGLIPVKTLDFHGGVNTTLGLPIVRTSPDHGTAFDIAGRNEARADSMIAAIKQAALIARNRAR